MIVFMVSNNFILRNHKKAPVSGKNFSVGKWILGINEKGGPDSNDKILIASHSMTR